MKTILILLIFISPIQTLFCLPPSSSVLNQENQYHLYLWAYYNQLEQKSTIAQHYFDMILYNNGSVYTYPGYIYHLYETNQFAAITKLIPTIDQHLSEHLETQLLLVKALELTNNQTQADQKIINLYNKFKNSPEVAYGTTLAYMKSKQTPQAFQVIDEFLGSGIERPINFIFYFLKAQLYMSNHDQQKAQENIKKALELNTSFDQGWLLSGLIHELAGNIDEAITGYRTFLQLTGRNKNVEQQLINLLFKKQNNNGFASMKKNFEQAFTLYKQSEFKQALTATEKCLTQDSSYRPARLLKIELLCALNIPKKAITLLTAWISKEPLDDNWYRALYLLYQAKIEQEAIIQAFKKIETAFPKNGLVLLYLADLSLKQKDRSTAIAYLKKALPLVEDKSITQKITYQLAHIYYEQQEFNALTQLFDQELKQKNNFSPFLNLAAYFYLTKEKNSIKAQKLISKSLKQEPKNPHYLDTQALIWYKQKKYNKAEKLLDSLAQIIPNDFFIHKHLSKVHYKYGNTKQAIALMDKALSLSCPIFEKNKCQTLVNKWRS
ncbi:MAG: hypothetical protein WDZ41_01150 [Candidatus Babeliales bacterium]